MWTAPTTVKLIASGMRISAVVAAEEVVAEVAAKLVPRRAGRAKLTRTRPRADSEHASGLTARLMRSRASRVPEDRR
jgi:hypothetical protein